MAVETRVIIDANASNAIKEIGKLDTAAADADKTIGELDGAEVDIDGAASLKFFEDMDRLGQDAIDQVKALSDQRVTITADSSDVVAAGGDVDAVEAKLKQPFRMDIDVDTDKLDRVKRSADDIDSSGRAASAAVGGLGGAVSELPGVSNLGPMAESMGQLTEGALEGEIAMSGLVAAAVPLAVIAVTLKAITDHFAEMGAAKAFRKEQVEEYTTALEGASSELDAIKAKLKEQGGVFVDIFKDGKPEDVTRAVNQVGLTVADFSRLAGEGQVAIDAWAQQMRDAGQGGSDLTLTVAALKRESEDLAAAQDAAAIKTQFFGEQTDATNGKVIASADELRAYTAALEDVPPEKKTEILALIDQGKLDAAERQLDELSKPRDVAFRAFLANPSFTSLWGVGTASSGGRSTTNNNLTVHVNATPDMRQTDAAIDRWQRLNGIG
jgi:hypothetical protein